MSKFVTYSLAFFMALYGVTILIELAVFRRPKRFFVQAIVLAVVFGVLNLTTGFPTPRTAFGGGSPVALIAIMFVCTLAGIAAHYVFYLRGKFDWRTFLKPMMISPIVLLPLVGSVQGATHHESLQLISFGFLAFQNGFFWKVVLEHATKQISGEQDAADPVSD